MAGIDFIPPSPAELAAIAALPIVQGGVRQAAEDALAYAQATAPVDTGAYRDSFHLEETPEGPALVNDDEAAAAIEWGSTDTPAHLTMTRAAEHVQAEVGGRP